MVFLFPYLPLLNEEEENISYGCSKDRKITVGWGSQSRCQIGASLELGREYIVVCVHRPVHS